jgi:3D (Asp-Asp-Asp) domain-containing protein
MSTKIKVIFAALAIILLFLVVFLHIDYSFAKKSEIDYSVKPAPKILSSKVWLTAYSSSPDETDDTPYITASGGKVRKGIVATNMLPLYSTIQIPEIFGDELFIVEDRMHYRKTNFVDVWMPSKEMAKEFGICQTEILIINLPSTELSLLQ